MVRKIPAKLFFKYIKHCRSQPSSVIPAKGGCTNYLSEYLLMKPIILKLNYKCMIQWNIYKHRTFSICFGFKIQLKVLLWAYTVGRLVGAHKGGSSKSFADTVSAAMELHVPVTVCQIRYDYHMINMAFQSIQSWRMRGCVYRSPLRCGCVREKSQYREFLSLCHLTVIKAGTSD